LQEDPVTLRRVIRVSAACAFLGGIMDLIQKLTPVGIIMLVLNGLLSFGGVVSFFGEMVYYRRFALRIPDPDLAASTRTLMWLLPLTLLVFLGLAVLLAIVAAPGRTNPGTANPGAGALIVLPICVVALVLLIGLIWYIRLLTKYKDAFQKAAMISRSLDANAGAPPGPASTTNAPTSPCD
jgi:hypothetical protein